MNSNPYNLLIYAVIGLLTILSVRLFDLQVVKVKVLSEIADGNSVRDRRVLPVRGSIYDRDSILLVHNVPTYTITLTPRYFEDSTTGVLGKHLAIPDSMVTSRLKEARQWNKWRPSPAFSNVTFEQYSRILEDSYLLTGVGTQVQQRRDYPTGVNASHALGYLGEITKEELVSSETNPVLNYGQGDLRGQSGIELGYEELLRGIPGKERYWVNVNGLEVKKYGKRLSDRQPRGNHDIYLTLDHRVQALAESLFVNKRGAVVALDPNDGGIIALMSKPDYSLDSLSINRNEYWQSLVNHKEQPLYNRATMNLMPPGSTWKPLMALFGMSHDLVHPEESIYCGGYHPIGRGRIFRCLSAHGNQTVVEAIKNSCNTFFFELARRMNLTDLKKYVTRFGFGIQDSTYRFEQTAGLIPDSAYYNRTRNYWTKTSTMNLGVGQGDMGVTPLQLARYTAALANGGTLYTPHMVAYLSESDTGNKKILPDRTEGVQLDIDPTHLRRVREGMRLVMEQGTGYMAQIPGIPSAGKTGTAQAPGNLTDHSVFIMFAPFEKPEIALAVQCENTGDGSQCAAPIASLLAEQYLKGEVPSSWRAEIRKRRALSATSQSLIPQTK